MITWHKFSYPDLMPPLNTGILVTDGDIITVTSLSKEWSNGSINDYYMNGHGFWGYEFDYDFDLISITHWALLPDMPNKEKP